MVPALNDAPRGACVAARDNGVDKSAAAMDEPVTKPATPKPVNARAPAKSRVESAKAVTPYLCGNHAIDATPARWRGDAGSSPLEHPTHWLISTQVPALLPRLAGPLRAALADPDADVCGFALTVLAPLAELCGAALEQFLDRLLPPVARRCGGRGKLAAAALDALRRVEESCPGAGAKIRRKVPAYR